MSTRKVTLELTLEQEETIKALFGHTGWDYKEVELTLDSNIKKEKRPRKSKQISRARENPRVADLGDEPAGQNLNLDGECQYCFMRPCITARNLQIVGSGQSACEDNSGIRKGIYKLYWKVLNNAGLWNNPRYLAVKVQRANGREWAISHKREVMPICVLVQLRALYPNPKGKPYMDHMWN